MTKLLTLLLLCVGLTQAHATFCITNLTLTYVGPVGGKICVVGQPACTNGMLSVSYGTACNDNPMNSFAVFTVDISGISGDTCHYTGTVATLNIGCANEIPGHKDITMFGSCEATFYVIATCDHPTHKCSVDVCPLQSDCNCTGGY